MKTENKFRYIAICILFVLCATQVDSQAQTGSGIRSSIGTRFNENTQLSISRPVSMGHAENSKSTPDYVLYKSVIRRNLWLEGQGDPITQDAANQLPCYFRLSMRNKKGHYQFVEALCSNDLTSNHTVSPYIKDKKILSPDDTVADLWDARFSTIGQWLITSDLEGERVVEERAYEAKSDKANLIYAFQPVYNDSSHVTGSYTDSWGLPIDIDDSGGHYYGSVVYLTLNSRGLDSIVDHIDAKGLCRYNEYGVDQTRFVYDNKDRLVSVASHNTVGDRVNDNRGFCATSYEYNDSDNTCIVTNVDKNLVPVLPSHSNQGNNFKKALIRFDSVGRKIEQIILE